MKTKEAEPELFSQFWQIWQPVCRESDGKPKARDAYRKHILAGALPQDIIDAARCHIRKRREAKTLAYIQLASSWLNSERYEFEAQEQRDFEARLAASQNRPASNVTPIRPAGQTAFLRSYQG